MGNGQNILFVCSQHRSRSPTAHHLYRGFLDYEVRSGGISPNVSPGVKPEDVEWADYIFAMEQKHVKLLRAKFGERLAGKRIVCLNILDIYQYMDSALVEELKIRVGEHLGVPE